MNGQTKFSRKGLIIGISAAVILVIAVAMVLMVVLSRARLNPQIGGIPGSGQTYEYFSFDGQSSPLYQVLLSANHDTAFTEHGQLSGSSVMRLSVDGQLHLLPDSYLYENYSSFDVACYVEENNFRNLQLRFDGEGVTMDGNAEDVGFSLVVDWNGVRQRDDGAVYLIFDKA